MPAAVKCFVCDTKIVGPGCRAVSARLHAWLSQPDAGVYPDGASAATEQRKRAQQRYQQAMGAQHGNTAYVHDACNRDLLRWMGPVPTASAPASAEGVQAMTGSGSDVEVCSQDQQRKRPPLTSTPGCTPFASPDKPLTSETPLAPGR